jgi:hypothetical protein
MLLFSLFVNLISRLCMHRSAIDFFDICKACVVDFHFIFDIMIKRWIFFDKYIHSVQNTYSKLICCLNVYCRDTSRSLSQFTHENDDIEHLSLLSLRDVFNFVHLIDFDSHFRLARNSTLNYFSLLFLLRRSSSSFDCFSLIVCSFFISTSLSYITFFNINMLVIILSRQIKFLNAMRMRCKMRMRMIDIHRNIILIMLFTDISFIICRSIIST